MNLELVGALNELEKERGISKEILMEAIEAAIVSAYKRHYGSAENVRVVLDDRTGRLRVYALKDVVEEVQDDATEISLAEAQSINPNYQLHDVVEIEVTPRDFGRIAAQTAKQVVVQRIREAERNLIYEEYANRVGDIVTGIVQRMDHRNVIIDLGRIESVLVPSEQMPGETYPPGSRIKVYITEVRKTPRGPQVMISRTHPGLLKRLFELEVPEIHDGIVEIKAVAREAGNRSKIAVFSHEPNVDPVGACVGPRGTRVQAVVQELKGEKIDIVEWSPDAQRFVANALSPAKVVQVYLNPEEKTARAVVPDHQLSLAIGKEGQNARLAARLSGWKIDIKSESQMAELAMLEAQRAFEEAEAALRAKRAAEQAAREQEAAKPAAELVPEEEPVEEPLVPVGAMDAAAAPADGEVPADGPEAVDELDAEFPEELPADEFPEEFLEPSLDELELEPEREKPAPAKLKKGRAAKRELQEIFEEEVLEEDEPLPSLFATDEDEAEDTEVTVYVAGPDDADDNPLRQRLAQVLGQVAAGEPQAADDAAPAPAAKDTKGSKGSKGQAAGKEAKKPKRVLKDLKSLADLLLDED
ncbi:MAG TPA: transcription termination factor NusA [Limnochordales bacterium]|nr:transcription termination factor NusA [Limnochordales bacterium]